MRKIEEGADPLAAARTPPVADFNSPFTSPTSVASSSPEEEEEDEEGDDAETPAITPQVSSKAPAIRKIIDHLVENLFADLRDTAAQLQHADTVTLITEIETFAKTFAQATYSEVAFEKKPDQDNSKEAALEKLATIQALANKSNHEALNKKLIFIKQQVESIYGMILMHKLEHIYKEKEAQASTAAIAIAKTKKAGAKVEVEVEVEFAPIPLHRDTSKVLPPTMKQMDLSKRLAATPTAEETTPVTSLLSAPTAKPASRSVSHQADFWAKSMTSPIADKRGNEDKAVMIRLWFPQNDSNGHIEVRTPPMPAAQGKAEEKGGRFAVFPFHRAGTQSDKLRELLPLTKEVKETVVSKDYMYALMPSPTKRIKQDFEQELMTFNHETGKQLEGRPADAAFYFYSLDGKAIREVFTQLKKQAKKTSNCEGEDNGFELLAKNALLQISENPSDFFATIIQLLNAKEGLEKLMGNSATMPTPTDTEELLNLIANCCMNETIAALSPQRSIPKVDDGQLQFAPS